MKTRIRLTSAMFLVLISCSNQSTKADNDFDVSVASPALKEQQPKVLFDEAHKNHHTIETTYKPFARLIQNDGCVVSSTTQPIDQWSLSGIDISLFTTHFCLMITFTKLCP